MFVGLECLGFNPNCLFQEVIAEGAYSDLAAVDVGIKIPQEQYGHWHHPGSDSIKRRLGKQTTGTFIWFLRQTLLMIFTDPNVF